MSKCADHSDEALLNEHLAAENEHSLDRIMATYGESPTIVLNGHRIEGTERRANARGGGHFARADPKVGGPSREIRSQGYVSAAVERPRGFAAYRRPRCPTQPAGRTFDGGGWG